MAQRARGRGPVARSALGRRGKLTRVLSAQLYGDGVPICGECHWNPSVREALGCDAPAKSVVFDTPCHCGRDPDCEFCDGTGWEPWDRCPRALIEKLDDGQSDIRSMVECYQQLDANGVLPVPGGLLDQSAGFVAFVNRVRREQGRWEKRRQAQREAEMKRMSK